MSNKQICDLIGQKFGKLTVIQREENDARHNTRWLCKCDCGKEKIVLAYNLKNGSTQSCGCLSKGNKKHGMRYTRLYNIWRSMRQRCSNPKTINYHNYGGKGVRVCEEWNTNFMNFYTWAIKNGYSDNLSIDRINSDGNYEPRNCRWVSCKIQNNNRRSNKYLEFDGQRHTIAEWADITGIKLATIWARLDNGWSVKDALTIRPIS